MASVNNQVNYQFRWNGLQQGQTGLAAIGQGAAVAAAAVVAAGAALWRLADRTTQTVGQFYDLSERTGIAASQLHAMSIAADQTGASLDGILAGLRRMPSFLDDAARGSATAVESLDRLGLTVEGLQGLSIEDQFYQVAEALASVSDESQRAALAQDIFGRSGMNLLPFLEDNVEGFRDMAAAARESGMVLEEDAYQSADAYQDKLTELKAQFLVLTMEGIEPVLPKLVEFAEGLMTTATEVLPALLQGMSDVLPVLDVMIRLLAQSAEGWGRLIELSRSYTTPSGDTPASEWLSGRPSGESINTGQGAFMQITGDLSRVMDVITPQMAELETASADIADNFTTTAGASASVAETVALTAEAMKAQADVGKELARMDQERAQAIADAQLAVEETRQSKILEMQDAQKQEQIAMLEEQARAIESIMGRAWDAAFSGARGGFGQLLKDLALDFAKSLFLKMIGKALGGAFSGGLGFLV